MTKSTTRERLERTRRRREKRLARNRDRLHAAEDRGLDLRATGEPLSLCASETLDTPTLPRFSAVAYTGGPMYPKLAIAWNGPVYVDLAGMESVSTNPIHRDHDEGKPIGHSVSVDNDGTRLVCSGVFSVSSIDTSEIVESAKQGFPWRPSVGVKIVSYTTLQAGQTASINGRIVEGPALWVKRSVLKEISLVTIPGDDSATISIAASQATPMVPDFASYCQSLGVDPAAASPELLQALQMAYAESVEPDSPEPSPPPPAGMDAGGGGPAPMPMQSAQPSPEVPQDKEKPAMANAHSPVDLAAADVSTYRAALAAEVERSNQVRDLCAKFGSPQISIDGKNVDLAAHAIANGWDKDKTELEARRHLDLEAARESRPRGPAIHSHSRDERQSLDALQAGMLLRAGCNLDSKQLENRWVKAKLPKWLQAGINDPVRQRAMDNGHAAADMSLVDACRLGLQARGVDVPAGRMDMIQAAFSSGSAAALFGATIGAKMLESYAEVDDFSQGWCSEDENPDLEQHNRNRTQAAQSLVYHPVGGEATHTGRTVTSERAQVFRFSRQMRIDEADILGDNFSKFKDTPRDFGLAAGRVRPDMVAMVLLSNPNLLTTSRALFNTTDGNMVASGKALARATLSELIAAIRKRRDGDASLDLPVTHLLVPPDILDTAVQLCYSVVISNDSGAGEMNPLKAYGITPVSEPRLSNGLTHPITGAALAGSPTQYYGVSNKSRTIEVTYLQGAGRTPVVRSETLTGGEFGLAIDVRHYIGATALDWRGFHRLNA
jgi:hypothetical protein